MSNLNYVDSVVIHLFPLTRRPIVVIRWRGAIGL